MNLNMDLLFSISDMNEHFPLVYTLLNGGKRVAELGVGKGILTDIILSTNPTSYCGCDHRYDDTIKSTVQRAKSYCESNNAKFWFEQCDSRVFDILDSDILIIDTFGHNRLVYSELYNHSPYISEYILIHDTEVYGEISESRDDRGLNYGIECFLAGTDKWELVYKYKHNNGLTVLKRVKPE